MVSEKNISFIQNFNKNGIAIVSEDFKDSVFCINRKYEKISDDYDYIKPAGQNLYVFPDEFGSEAYYSFKRGKFIKESRTFSGYLGEFNNDIALVLDDDGLVSSGTVSYYIDRKFRIVSPLYSYAEEFDENKIARVIDCDGNYQYINEKYERISPYFKEVTLPNKDNIVVASEIMDDEIVQSYYQFDNGALKRVSDVYKKCTHFSSGINVVQDLNSNKFYIIDSEFKKISKDFDDVSQFAGVYNVFKAETKGKKYYLTKVTGSKVNNPNLYNETVKLLDREGFQHPVKAIYESRFYESAKKADLSDLKVAIKDFLVSNIDKIYYDKKTNFYKISKKVTDRYQKTTKAISNWINEVSDKIVDIIKEETAQKNK